jgi:post-segregation antitoxin (ccd killing protein)
MEITQQLRDYAREQGVEVSTAVEEGLAEKARQYREERLAREADAVQSG